MPARSLVLAAVATALVVVAVPQALATHDFTDIPDSSPFHADVAAVKRAGITTGKTCSPPGTPPTFCPNDDVPRQAAAAFMHRGLSRVAQSTVVLDASLSPTGFTKVGSVTIEVGGTGGTQHVHAEGRVSLSGSDPDCPCTPRAFVKIAGAPADGPTFFEQWPLAGQNQVTVEAGDVFGVASGTHTFELWAAVFELDAVVNASGVVMTATTHAFDGTE